MKNGGSFHSYVAVYQRVNNDGFTEVMAASRKVNDFSVAPMLLQSMRQEQAGYSSNEGDETLIVEEVGDSQPRIRWWYWCIMIYGVIYIYIYR